MAEPLVGIIMGSSSDWETMRHASATLDQLSVAHETKIVSAHRTPKRLYDYAHSAKERGLKVVIAGAGGAAHLPGMTASMTPLPVLGVPIETQALKGMDSLLSIVQMPAGVPVGTLAIGKAGAVNAALLAAAILSAQDEALLAIRGARRLKPKQPDNFGMFTSDTIIGIYNSATSGIFTILIGVVGLSLVVGGIVIMNIMLMVVTERTREIGLRKALGAKRRDIMSQMLTESVVLSVFGGVVGTFLGTTIALIISNTTPIPAAVEAWSIALGIGITALVGLFFGLYPASRAARLDPIEALRRE